MFDFVVLICVYISMGAVLASFDLSVFLEDVDIGMMGCDDLPGRRPAVMVWARSGGGILVTMMRL